MSKTQLPFLVEGILILVTMTVGFLLKSKGKPYGKVKLAIHVFFFLWFSMGFYFIVRTLALTPATQAETLIWIPVDIMGLALLVQLVTGILMVAFRKVGKGLPAIHVTSAVLMLLADICAFFMAGRP